MVVYSINNCAACLKAGRQADDQRIQRRGSDSIRVVCICSQEGPWRWDSNAAIIAWNKQQDTLRTMRAVPMTSTAFLLLGVDTRSRALIGLDLFSEENPTLMVGVRTFVALIGCGDDYMAGVAHIKRQLDDPLHQWMKPLVSARASATLDTVGPI